MLTCTAGVVNSQEASGASEESVKRGVVLFASDPHISDLTIITTPELRNAQERQLLPPDEASAVLGEKEHVLPERIWSLAGYHWTAPNVYHRPLYFEQVNLERYGHYRKHWHVESAISSAHFFGTALVLPLKALHYFPCERVYTLGHHRPGNCNPNQRHAFR